MDKLGVFRANQASMCPDPHLNFGAVKHALALWPFQGGSSFVDCLCYLCLVFVIFSRLIIATLWSPAGKGLTSWPLFVMFNCSFVTFPYGILGQVWYLILLIPDLLPPFLLS